MKLPSFITGLWGWLRRPSGRALGSLLLVGFVGGIMFWGAFNTGMEMTNQEQFCIGCHEMQVNVYEEYITTVHYNNRSGVRATCPDCHVPKDWTHKIVRKIQASKELWGKAIGIVDTPKKFSDHRLVMAEREWARMRKTDSQECRNCHNFEYMDFTEQKSVAGRMHASASELGKTCIDCHKGIAHRLPEDYAGNDAISQALQVMPQGASH
ncbi:MULTISPECIES: NapC/NirT family cytochrome c [Ferrimonas]|uniref:NapC/NirT family cytochrome c n=1 Tax=Ferrimonas TaxID=44011 RepID=UPI000422C0AB|nr:MULTISPECIES: NapC/NirT family cytochrome c [Ferrimonas]USD36340.1 NapC/NirT family cytochrome c [Ferrimonas sp. SCSIO 43195]